MTRSLAARLGLGLALVALPVSPRAVGQSQRPTFRAAADAVTLPVSVRAADRPVDGLTLADFELLDNGVEQPIDSVSTEGVPLDLTVAVDTSGSTRRQLGDFKRRVASMVELLGPRDRIRLLTFSDFVHEVFSLRPGDRVDESSVESIRTEGWTAARNAIVASTIGSPEEPGRRRIVVIFTDGIDSWSTVQSKSMLDVVRRSDVTIHVGGSTRNHDIGEAVDLSGGRAHSTGSMVEVFQRILDEARGSYVLRYTPTGVEMDGWHDIEVRVRRPGRYDIRARRGYFGR